MKYTAHKTEDGREQTVLEHLNETAKRAESNAVPIMQDLAYAAGLAHDIGKYAAAFQARIQNGSRRRFEHALCGSLEYWKLHGIKLNPFVTNLLAYCIAGHHTGLPDGGQKGDTAEDSTLLGRLQRQSQYTDDRDYAAFRSEITLSLPEAGLLTQELMRYSKAQNREPFLEVFSHPLSVFLPDRCGLSGHRAFLPSGDQPRIQIRSCGCRTQCAGKIACIPCRDSAAKSPRPFAGTGI